MVKQSTPSAERNLEVVRQELLTIVPDWARHFLEIGSGTGQHGGFIAPDLGHLTWWPTDTDETNFASIAAYAQDTANMQPPQKLDVTVAGWAGQIEPERADIMFAANVVHITPWVVTQGLLAGAGEKLSVGGKLALYGPFRQRGVETAQSNEAFDVWLKDRDPAFGLRFVEDVADEAASHDLSLDEVRTVPANNLVVVLKKG